jgi:RNA polymerase sigma factor (sigma-70 family)
MGIFDCLTPHPPSPQVEKGAGGMRLIEGAMELNDLKIKNLIRDCLSAGEGGQSQFFQKLREETELYVYNFPRLAYKKKLDICSDFYIYMVSRLEKVFQNFPLDAGIKFKTYFNAALKNHFLNFMRYQKPAQRNDLCIDDYADEVFVEFFEQEDAVFEDLKEGLSMLGEADRIILKLYYIPESLDTSESRKACELFSISPGDFIKIQKDQVAANLQEIKRLRETAEKIGGINQILLGLKSRLGKGGLGAENSLLEASEMMQKIARYEAVKNREIRSLKIPEKSIFKNFASLYKNAVVAKQRLELARRKLKIELMRLLNKNKGLLK